MTVRRGGAPVNPHRLGDRGLALYEAVAGGRPLSAPLSATEVVTLVEACRLADRLEKFDGLISGDRDEWLRLDLNETGDELTVVLTDVVRQARMHAATLKALLAGFETPKASEGADELPKEVPSNVASIKDGIKKPAARRPAARSQRSTV